jgi:hypothetical protein
MITKVFTIMEASLGMLALAWPLAWGTGWTYAMASAGAVCVLAAVAAHWRPGPVLAVAAAITACAFSRAGTFVLAVEGVLVLCYLLAVHAPAGLTRPGPWLRQQVFAAVAGLVASGAVLAALALHQVSSAVLTAAGLGAAALAYLVALPLRGRAGRGSDVDVQ